MLKNALTALTLTAAFFAASPAAEAGDHVHSNVVVAGHYETQNQRIRVEGRVVVKTRQVAVAGYYQTSYQNVQIPGRYETRTERVWVPEQLVRESGRRRGIRVDAGPVTLDLNGRRRSTTRCIPAHYETRSRRVWIAPCTQRRAVKVWVPACTRPETYQVRTPDCFENRSVRVWVPAAITTCCSTKTRRHSETTRVSAPRSAPRSAPHRERSSRRDERGNRRYERSSRRESRSSRRRHRSGVRVEFGF